MKVMVSRATRMWPLSASRASHWAFQTSSFRSLFSQNSSSSCVPLASLPLPSMDWNVSYGWKSLGTSSVKSASRLGPKPTTRLMFLAAQSARSCAIADLIAPMSAPSMRLRCTYHWCWPMFLLRTDGCGVAIPNLLTFDD